MIWFLRGQTLERGTLHLYRTLYKMRKCLFFTLQSGGRAPDQDDRAIKATPSPSQPLTLPCFCLDGMNIIFYNHTFAWLSHNLFSWYQVNQALPQEDQSWPFNLTYALLFYAFHITKNFLSETILQLQLYSYLCASLNPSHILICNHLHISRPPATEEHGPSLLFIALTVQRLSQCLAHTLCLINNH